MTLSDLKDRCWAIARDTAIDDEDRLWPSCEMTVYINRVYNQIARETKCIKDSSTPEICLIDLVPIDYTTYEEGTIDYIFANSEKSALYHRDVAPYLIDLDSRILEILDAKLIANQWRLTKTSVRKWQENPYWEQVISVPTEYATDLETDKIALNFRSESSDTIQLQVKRMPLRDMSSETDVPELKLQYHDLMINGILYYMYSKQDADTFDEEASSKYYNLFLLDIDYIKRKEIALDTRLQPNHSLGAFR